MPYLTLGYRNSTRMGTHDAEGPHRGEKELCGALTYDNKHVSPEPCGSGDSMHESRLRR